jgi:hypothetical protein
VTVEVVPVTLAGLKVTVIPVGAPVAVRATAPVNGAVRVSVSALVPWAPCWTLSVAGARLSEKLPVGAAWTTRVSGAVTAVTPEPVARIVIGVEATATDANVLTERVPVVWPAAIVSPGSVTPVGRPSAAMVTAPSNPPVRVSVTPTDPLFPCWTVRLEGDRAI